MKNQFTECSLNVAQFEADTQHETLMQRFETKITPMSIQACIKDFEVIKKPDFTRKFGPLCKIFETAVNSLPQGFLAYSAHKIGHMYKTVDGSELSKRKDGYYTTICKDEKNGKITKHTPLKKGSPCFEAAATIYSIASTVTGQTCLMNIASKLDNISTEIEEVKEFLYSKEINAIESAIWSIGEIKFDRNDQGQTQLHICRGRLDEACRNLYTILDRNVRSLKGCEPPRFLQGWLLEKDTSPVKAEKIFRQILNIFPVYLKGMLYLVATEKTDGTQIRLAQELYNLAIKHNLKDVVGMVPMLTNENGERFNPESFVEDVNSLNENLKNLIAVNV